MLHTVVACPNRSRRPQQSSFWVVSQFSEGGELCSRIIKRECDRRTREKDIAPRHPSTMGSEAERNGRIQEHFEVHKCCKFWLQGQKSGSPVAPRYYNLA